MFVHMEHFEDLLFQLMKNGTNTLRVTFIFLFSIVGNNFTILGCRKHLAMFFSFNYIDVYIYIFFFK